MSAFEESVGAYTRLGVAWLRYAVRTAPRSLLRRLRQPATLGIAYAAIGLATFGHVAAANYHDTAALKLKQAEICNTSEKRLENDSFCYQSFDYDFPLPAIRGLAAGAFWPLYLSWELQQ